MTNKERYRQICETEGSQIPLFLQYWWMETVCKGKQWDVILVGDDGHYCGALPFLYGKKFGLKYILLPQLTPWSGPWLRDGMEALGRKATLGALAYGLRDQKAMLCMQRFAPGIAADDCQCFVQYGFNLTPRHTYRFDPIPVPETLRKLADRGRRRGVEAIDKAYTIDREVTAEEFANLHINYWKRRNGHDLLSHEFIQRVCSTALGRKQALLYGLRDKKGTLMSARFVVYDSHCAYALMSAMRHNALRNSMTVLVWSMLTDLYGRTDAFDFEGGMDPGVGHFYSSFGTKQTELQCIYHSKIPFGSKLLHL